MNFEDFEWSNNLLVLIADLPSPFIFSLHEEELGCREAGGEERESEEEVEDCLGVHGCGRLFEKYHRYNQLIF